MEARKTRRKCAWGRVALALGLIVVFPSLTCQAAEEAPFPTTAGVDPVVVPTFTCLGLYWAPANGGDDHECAVRYHAVGANEWQEALPLWFDTRNREYRGSIANLEPDTVYEIALKLEGTTRTVRAHTWSERFPVIRAIRLPEHSGQALVMDQSGTADGYVLYTAAEGKRATIDVEGKADECVVIKASYVILRGVALRGGGTNGITIEDGSHDVIIERCDISGWGRVAPDGQGRDYDAGVAAKGSGVRRVVLQRNNIHHPRADTNSWKEPRATEHGSTNHPLGPQGVSFFDTGGNHVIRYNEVYSDEEHRFNDCLGGGENFSYAGFPNRDSDIYGNRLSECWDDAIESEGANANVRIWGNFITNTFVKIAIASVSIGPMYIWRNVAGTSRYSPIGTTDEDEHGPFLKGGSRNRYNGGKIFVFHNTLLQPPPPAGLQKTLGCNIGLSSYGGDVLNMTSRNNILHIVSERSASIGSRTTSPTNDFDYDLYNGRIDGPEKQETHGLRGTPVYGAGNAAGCFWLAADSPGCDAGVRLPNFNDGFTGKAPDMGAHERGTRAMEFGVDAYMAR